MRSRPSEKALSVGGRPCMIIFITTAMIFPLQALYAATAI